MPENELILIALLTTWSKLVNYYATEVTLCKNMLNLHWNTGNKVGKQNLSCKGIRTISDISDDMLTQVITQQWHFFLIKLIHHGHSKIWTYTHKKM
jgi:hypothetical protein